MYIPGISFLCRIDITQMLIQDHLCRFLKLIGLLRIMCKVFKWRFDVVCLCASIWVVSNKCAIGFKNTWEITIRRREITIHRKKIKTLSFYSWNYQADMTNITLFKQVRESNPNAVSEEALNFFLWTFIIIYVSAM